MSYQLPIGVPNPSWGVLDSINITNPTQPEEWPAASNAAWYYIDSDHIESTDAANTNGYPDKPRKTVPSSLSAGDKVFIVKTITSVVITSSGTEENPIWVLGNSVGIIIPASNDTYLNFSGAAYVIADGLIIDGTGAADTSSSVAWSIRDGSNHICIRNCIIRNMVVGWYNPDRFGSGGAAAWYSGLTNISPTTGDVNDIIIYSNDISNNAGGQALDYESGRHCIIASGDSDGIYRVERVWILANTFNDNPEDGIQLGQTALDSDRTLCRYFYIADNTISNNGENAIDLKACDKIVVSQNRIFGYKTTNYREGAVSGSDGTACVINDDGGGAAESWWIFNKIYNSRGAFRNQSAASQHYLIGNIIHDILLEDGDSEPITAGNGQGVAYFQSAGGSNAYLINNTLHNVHGGIYMNNVNTGNVVGNIVHNIINHVSGWPINVNNFTAFNASYNIYYDPSGNVRQDANALGVTDKLNQDPSFNTGNFTIDSNSIAKNLVSDFYPFSEYFTTFGVTIAMDYNRQNRDFVWDAGAINSLASYRLARQNFPKKVSF